MFLKDNIGNIGNNIDIVIAHYSEDLERAKPYAKNTIIYHKGEEKNSKFTVKKRIKIKNVGREGETYLQHIINNYNNLADITIFLQGGIHDQLENKKVYGDLREYIREVKKYNFSTRRTRFIFKKDPQIVFDAKYKERYDNGLIRHSKYSFAEFYKKTFGKNQPLIFPCFFSANFAVSKETIHKRPKQFYEKIHQHLTNHNNPEEGHYLERFWFIIFNENLNFHYFTKILNNPFIGILYHLGLLLKKAKIYNKTTLQKFI